jgi:hypothetical protein
VKLILYLDLGKGVKFDNALGSLKDIKFLDVLYVHMDVDMPRLIVGRQ